MILLYEGASNVAESQVFVLSYVVICCHIVILSYKCCCSMLSLVYLRPRTGPPA